MNPPTAQRFLFTIGNGLQAAQLVSINVIVSQDGRLRLDVRSEDESSTLTPSRSAVIDTSGRGDANPPVGPSPSSVSNPIVPSASHPPGFSPTASSSPDVAEAPSTPHLSSGLPPVYSAGTPPPAYSNDIPPSMPTSLPAAVATQPALPVPPVAPGLVAIQLSSTAAPNVPVQAPTQMATRLRGRARPTRRRVARHFPVPPPVVAGPGFLSALVTFGLDMLPVKRRPESNDGGRDAKRRRL
ncbi:hypothetical protein DFH07DRAFT_854010 [Mycena maculata]|uniref:Uncharacterized protein n=1 Tax=Mycena maculata TaxID=230809 RepID=A0AAD7HPR6_9AGAR|nr:hypothetical protein DFH07DRAFT_854010 [Mycena maculata]